MLATMYEYVVIRINDTGDHFVPVSLQGPRIPNISLIEKNKNQMLLIMKKCTLTLG